MQTSALVEATDQILHGRLGPIQLYSHLSVINASWTWRRALPQSTVISDFSGFSFKLFSCIKCRIFIHMHAI